MAALFKKEMGDIRHIFTLKFQIKKMRGHRCNHWEIFMHAYYVTTYVYIKPISVCFLDCDK